MKYINFILFILSFTMIMSCENAELQKAPAVTDSKITPRFSCEPCTEADKCCCYVELQQEEEQAFLVICGSTNSTSDCVGAPPVLSGCPEFNGVEYIITLDDMNPRHIFCSLMSGPFSIINTDLVNSAIINLSCQGTDISPQVIPITIPPNSKVYYNADEFCFLEICD